MNAGGRHDAPRGRFGGRPRILVVDDEQEVRAVVADSLAALDFEAESVASGAEALAALAVDPDRFDCVLTDAVMPEMSGSELAATIAREHAGIPVVLMSGYAGTGGAGGPRTSYLQKPFTLDELEDAVRSALDSGDPA